VEHEGRQLDLGGVKVYGNHEIHITVITDETKWDVPVKYHSHTPLTNISATRCFLFFPPSLPFRLSYCQPLLKRKEDYAKVRQLPKPAQLAQLQFFCTPRFHPMASRILPPPLEPYLGLPKPTTLILLTGILGASSNWLVLRCLHSLLRSQRRSPAGEAQGDQQDGRDGDDVSVVFLSFLRDYAFWREGASRLGLDLEGLRRKGKFAYVDGLSGLFVAGSASQPRTRRPNDEKDQWVLASPAVTDVARILHAAVDALTAHSGGPRVVVVVDQLDLLLAAAGGEGGVSALALRELLFDLREVGGLPASKQGPCPRRHAKTDILLSSQKAHAVILAVASDEPLVTAQATTLEKEHAAFILSLAHEAHTVMSLRLLDTGTAKDVSGVVRITGGGDDSGPPVEEKEFLYHVGGDGGVRVFERGQ